jgi:hypothetical protein
MLLELGCWVSTMEWATSLTQTSVGGDEHRTARDGLTAKLLTAQRNF